MSLYFTPASIGYLNLSILSLLIAVYAGMQAASSRGEQSPGRRFFLPAIFLCTALFSIIMFLEVSLLFDSRLIPVFLENVPMALLLAAVIQYAYHFPAPRETQKTEREIALAVTSVYALIEIGSAIWRIFILREGRVEYRHGLADIPIVLGFIWTAVIFARNYKGKADRRVGLQFMLVFLIPAWLSIVGILRLFYPISIPIYHASLSIGALLAVFLFALNNLAFQPEKTSLIVRLSGTALVATLAVFGMLAWLMPFQSEPEAALQNEYLAFRTYMHGFMLPIAVAALACDAFFLIVLPLLFRNNFSRPLQNLIEGIQGLNRGKRKLTLPVQVNDEIGLLTSTFNSMTAELDSLISNLEERVGQRTAELIDANRVIQNSQHFFEGLFEVSPDAVLTVNAQGCITQVNAQTEAMFGYSRVELLGKPIETLVPESAAASHALQRETYQTQPRNHSMDNERVVHGRHKSGREFPVEVLLRPFESKSEMLVLAVIRDVSHRLDVEKSLRRRNETLSALDQVMLELINRHDVDDILNIFLEKAASLLDTPEVSIDLLEDENTLVNYSSMKHLPVQKGDRVSRSDRAALSWQAVDTRQPAVIDDYSTWEHRRGVFDGYPVYAVLVAPILQGERVLGTINFTRDRPDHPFDEADIYVAIQLAQMVALTLNNSELYSRLRSELVERRQIEEVLRISQENFISYFNMGSVGMCVITPEKEWVEVNDRLCKMLGYSRDELKQTHWNDLSHLNDLADETALFERTLRDEYESHQMNKRFLRKDGSMVYTSMYISCQRYTERSAWYFLVSLVDITERILQEQALQQAQAELMEQKLTSATLEERQRLARNLHDSLSQSVHSLVLFSQTLQSALEKNNFERAKQIVEQVQESARQSHKETRLLLYELQASGKGRSMNLIHELETRLTKVENHAGIESQIVVKGPIKDIPPAWIEDLYWMTIEALNNALKHAQARKVKVIINVTKQEVELEIIDNGRGFSVEKAGMGGMGLTNMRERAALFAGELTIESKPRQGTRVHFRAKIKE